MCVCVCVVWCRYPLCDEILREHEEVEEMLEAYTMDLAALDTQLTDVKARIQSAEEHVSSEQWAV